MHTLVLKFNCLLLVLLGGQKHSTGWAKIATGWAIAHPVNMLSEALVDKFSDISSVRLRNSRLSYVSWYARC